MDKLQIRDSDWLKFPPHVVSPYRDELQIWINCFGWLKNLPRNFQYVHEGCGFA